MFLFYCYKENFPESLEDKITKDTKFKNFIFNGRRIKFIYILLNESGIPEKILSCKRNKYDLTESIIPVKRIYPNMMDPNDNIIVEDWFEGNVLNPLSNNEVILAMKWLANFQNRTSFDFYSHEDIEREVNNLKNELDTREEVKDYHIINGLTNIKNM